MKEKPEIEHKTEYDLVLYNTLRIKSIANDVYLPKTIDEFTLLLANLENPLVIGRGSNILLSSFGISRPVILIKNLCNIKIDENNFEVETGVSASKLAEMALELQLTGFEFLACLPSTLGGAVCMNAGAMGQEIADNFVSAKVYDSDNDEMLEFNKEDMGFSYRNSKLKNQTRYFLLSTKFTLKKAESFDSIQNLMDKNFEKRKNSQPSLKDPNLGCVFKNPILNGEKVSAGKLIDECDLKSKPMGGAMIYHKHANFIINFNNATSLDYLNLMKEIQDKVYEKFNIILEPEIIYAGENKDEAKIWNSLIQK